MSVCDEWWYTIRHVIPLGAGGRGGDQEKQNGTRMGEGSLLKGGG